MEQLTFGIRRFKALDPHSETFDHVHEVLNWNPEETAAAQSDMWDQHWCKGATARVREMAPRMNEVFSKLREMGVLIVHGPSDTLDRYREHPARRRVLEAARACPRPDYPDLEVNTLPLPLDASDEGCWCEPKCEVRRAWSGQTDLIPIDERDAITDSEDIFSLYKARGIKNVLFFGVHLNMCVLNRPFAIRALLRRGFNVVLVRDLTDAMYNPALPPYVDHFTGNDLLIAHIEKYICPTTTSDEFIGGAPFRFREDQRTNRE